MPIKRKVTEWLALVNYDGDSMYIPGEFALEFVSFIKLVNGDEGEEHKSPVLHFRMLDQIPGKKQDLVNMVFRGAAKTTLLGEYLFLYIAVYGGIPGFGDVPLAIYVSDSIENGVKNMRKNLEYRWENSEFLQKYVPEIKFTDIRWEFINISKKKFIVKGYGAKTGVRGTKEMGVRPVLAVLDDLISDEDARSDTVIKSVEDTVDKAIEYALHPTKRKVIWSGTPFNARDPLYKAVESGAYYVNVYPVCTKFPCSRDEFKSAWPDRFNYDAVNRAYKKAKKKGKIHDFDQEMMLRIMSDEDRLVADEEIEWYSRSTLIKRKGAYNFYITTDFATSANESADFSVIFVWAINSQGHWFLVDGMCKRQLMDKNIDELFRLVQKYRPQEVGVEISGQQKGFVSWIQREMDSKNNWFVLAREKDAKEPGLRTTTDKMAKFMVVLPLFKQHKIHFPEEWRHKFNDEWKYDERIKHLIEELELAAPNGFRAKTDDNIDGVSQLGSLRPWIPDEDVDRESELWADEDLGNGFAETSSSYVV